MPILLILISLNVLIFVFMIAIILGSGWVEGKKPPERQDRP